jgi:hypothetical protein
MGRLCCGHGVYVSTAGSTTGLLWEDYVVVMVSMCLLGALLLEYYGRTVLWSRYLCSSRARSRHIETMTTTQSSHNNPVEEPPVDT